MQVCESKTESGMVCNKSTYVEAIGTVTLILGKAFRGLGGTVLACLVVFSVRSGVDVQVRFGILALDTAALP